MRDEFEIFVKDHQDMVFSTAMRITGSFAESEDISQQVFLQAYHQFDSLRVHINPGGWLRLAARNLSINHVKRYFKRWYFFDTVSEIPPEIESAVQSDGDKTLLFENMEKVKKVLGELPPKFRVPLVLFYYERLSYQEIAMELSCSEAKVKTDLFRSKKIFQEKLEKMRDA